MSFHRKHQRVQAAGGGESRTKQSFKDECDINNILKQYQRTGVIKHVRAAATSGRFEDLPSDVDFQMAMHTIMQANDAFASLPAKVRARFNNDPEQFLSFFSDPAHLDEAVELGLITRTPEPPPLTPSPGEKTSTDTTP